MTVTTLISLNGMYDIFCALSILDVIDVPYLDQLHISMFEIYHEPLVYRIMAFWILMYGMVRFTYPTHRNNNIVVHSYLLEGLLCFQEGFVNMTMYQDKAFYVAFLSFMFALMAYLNKH